MKASRPVHRAAAPRPGRCPSLTTESADFEAYSISPTPQIRPPKAPRSCVSDPPGAAAWEGAVAIIDHDSSDAGPAAPWGAATGECCGSERGYRTIGPPDTR